MSAPQKETDLYRPIHDYLCAQGYTVRSEVKGCDVTATRGEDLLVIELKLRFTLDLLIQGMRRQKISDSVYVAVPRPSMKEWRARWRGIRMLLRRMELGLIFVSFAGARPVVEVVAHPVEFSKRRNPKARRAVLTEITGRSVDLNVGGSTRQKLVTAYRESAIHVACCLDRFGHLSPRQLREMGTGAKTLSILSSNFYGWFERVGRGLYRLKEASRTELAAYRELVASFREKLDGLSADAPNGKSDKTVAMTKKKRKSPRQETQELIKRIRSEDSKGLER